MLTKMLFGFARLHALYFIFVVFQLLSLRPFTFLRVQMYFPNISGVLVRPARYMFAMGMTLTNEKT